ncbi:MAG: FlgO family outer membrane protein [Desulfocapsaceae bacterium]|nr:FlgO family outer membrane protein [Desulfocapsaceae bacterium]
MHTYPAIIFQRLLLAITLSLLLAGCSAFNCTRLEQQLGAEQNLITLAEKITDKLTQDAFPPLMPRQPDLPILTTTFVNNDNLKETSRFGRILQEHITSRLVQLNYTAKELKLRQSLLMQEQSGETMLSRNLRDLDAKQSLVAQAILVGTYSYTERVMYISARLINPKDRTIISSYDYRLCMDDNVLAMFGLQRQPSSSGDEVDPPRKSLINTLFY